MSLPIEANITLVESVVPGTAAMGSAGQALTPAASSSIRLARGPIGGPLEFKAGAAGWVQLDSNEGIDLPIDLAATVVMVRKATTTSAAIPLLLTVRTVATTAPAGQVPAASGGATPITISGIPFVGNKLTAAIAAGWQNAGGNWTRAGTNISGATALEYTLVTADSPGPVTYKSSNIPFVPTGVAVAAAPVVPVAPAITTAPALSGGGTVGQPITLTPGAVTGTPTPTSTFSWRDAGGTELSTSASAFTPVAAGQITATQSALNSAGSVTRTSNTVTVAAAPAYPVMRNAIVTTQGDSRTAVNTSDDSIREARRIRSRGYAQWMLLKLRNSIKYLDNYGINSQSVQGNLDRNFGLGGAAGVEPTNKGKMLVYESGSVAGAIVYLIGTNNLGQELSITAPIYDQLFGEGIENGSVAVIVAEIPDGSTANPAAQVARRDYLRAWPDSSTTLTTAKKAQYKARRVIVDVWDQLAANPGATTPASAVTASKTGYYGITDPLHPIMVGNRVIGEALADALLPLLQASNLYTPRDALPTTVAQVRTLNPWLTGATWAAITATAGEAADGTTGFQNKDGNGGVGIAGVLPTGCTFVRDFSAAANGAQDGTTSLQVRTSLVQVDGRDALRVTIKGKVAGNAPKTLTLRRSTSIPTGTWGNTNGAGQGLEAGKKYSSVCRQIVGVNPIGFHGIQSDIDVTNSSLGIGASTNRRGAMYVGLSGDETAVRVPFPAIDGFVATPDFTITSEMVGVGTNSTLAQSLLWSFQGDVTVDLDTTIVGWNLIESPT